MSHRLGLTAALALAVAAVAASAQASRRQPAVITVTPHIVAEYDWAHIRVDGLAGQRAVEVRLVGASGTTGAPLGWIELQRQDGSWTARLPQPVLPGIYPIRLRGTPPLRGPVGDAYLRVYDQRVTYPMFATPEAVASWWVTHVAEAEVVAIRRRPETGFDHRLTHLHRLFVVAYSPPGDTDPADRLGAWITAVREGYRGRWHLLEASVTPP